jgi:hypothetical protein
VIDAPESGLGTGYADGCAQAAERIVGLHDRGGDEAIKIHNVLNQLRMAEGQLASNQDFHQGVAGVRKQPL